MAALKDLDHAVGIDDHELDRAVGIDDHELDHAAGIDDLSDVCKIPSSL